MLVQRACAIIVNKEVDVDFPSYVAAQRSSVRTIETIEVRLSLSRLLAYFGWLKKLF